MPAFANVLDFTNNLVGITLLLYAASRHPLTRRIAAAVWQRIRRDLGSKRAALLAMSPWRRAAYLATLSATLPPLWAAMAMGEAAPYPLQMWVGTVMLFVFGATAWFGTRDVVRAVRGRRT